MSKQRPNPDEWLTTKQLAAKLGYRPVGVREMMANGTFREGVHWFERDGSRPLFWWPGVARWLKGSD